LKLFSSMKIIVTSFGSTVFVQKKFSKYYTSPTLCDAIARHDAHRIY
jgi:hypothetical protein